MGKNESKSERKRRRKERKLREQMEQEQLLAEQQHQHLPQTEAAETPSTNDGQSSNATVKIMNKGAHRPSNNYPGDDIPLNSISQRETHHHNDKKPERSSISRKEEYCTAKNNNAEISKNKVDQGTAAINNQSTEDHMIRKESSTHKHKPPSLSLPSSRKRPLVVVDFVYPQHGNENGKLKPYVFTKLRKSDNGELNNNDAHIIESSAVTESKEKRARADHIDKTMTLDEILNLGQRKKQKVKHRRTDEDDFTTGNTSSSRLQANTHTPSTQQSDAIIKTGDRTLDDMKKIAATKDDRTSLAAGDRSRNDHASENDGGGHLSGYSVEDAVRDKWGCRPRSNSTDAELNLPQRGLCDERKVLQWHKWNHVQACYPPTGFINLGNTCFLNSTLQCLAYLPPFCQALLSLPAASVTANAAAPISVLKNGMNKTQQSVLSTGKRITMKLRALFRKIHGDATTQSNDHERPRPHGTSTIAPREIVKAVPTLGTCGNRSGYKFRPGRQEDAHEFLVHLLDAMNDGELREAGINQHASGWRDKLPIPRLDETTFVHRVFGGYFRNQLKCTSCGMRSNTYDPFLDLSLEVSGKFCQSIEQAIKEFTRKETLDSQNKWKCCGCKKRVCATKQLTVFRPPLSLCIQLKRFTFGGIGGVFGFGGGGKHSHFGGGGDRYGKKITKPVAFPAQLELPLSDGRSCGYSLTGVVIHVGGSASSGHYTAYVKKPSRSGVDQWFHCDDSFVQTVSEKIVLRQKDAYVLFYCRKEVRLEFPAPPLRSSMTAEEAKLFGRSRARSRSDSLLERQNNVPLMPPATEVEPGVPRKERHDKSEIPKNAKETKSISSSNEVLQPNASSKQKGTVDNTVLTKKAIHASSEGNTSTRVETKKMPSGNDKQPNHKMDSRGNEESQHVSDGEKKVESLSKQEKQALDVDGEVQASQSESDHDSSTSSSSQSIENAGATKLKPVVSDKRIPTMPNSKPASNHGKKTARIVLDRGYGKGKVEVNVGVRATTRVWKPKTTNAGSGDEYGLLGNRRVEQWIDQDDHPDNAIKQSSGSSDGRSKIVETVLKNEREKKRKLYTDRWDASLDQGKLKKVKKNSDSIHASSTHPAKNQFQRIQSSLHRVLHYGRRNDNSGRKGDRGNKFKGKRR